MRICLLPPLILILACGDDAAPAACRVDDDCSPEICVDQRCVPRVDSGAPDGSPEDSGASCESALFCGSPPSCCALGEECIAEACVPACASGVRCGGSCCAEEQVCVTDSCRDVGELCADSYDCEEGAFCEPTLRRCLPQFDPISCEVRRAVAAFEPVLEWSATEFEDEPDFYRSTVMPVVIDIDGDGVTEVLQTYFGGEECRGVLRAHDGQTGEVRWLLKDVDGSQVSACPTGAAGDIDGDGAVEMIIVLHDGRLAAVGGDGSVEWTSTNAGAPYSVGEFRRYANAAIAIADVIPGGTPEIAIGAVLFSGSGDLLWSSGEGVFEGDNNNYNGGLPAIADVNLDGAVDVVSGRNVWNRDGTLLYTIASTDGYPAIGNFDDDPQPEIVLVSQGQVVLVDGVSGAIQGDAIAIPGGGRGGPPTIADFDGDGMPEIGVAGATNYVVLDPAGERDILWQMPTQDASSNATGSAVFDFEGDGSAEVVYGDECFVRAYRGTDGELLFELPNPSGTQHEYPVTADVDGDGNTEILFVANGVRGATEFRGCEANAGWDAAERAGLFVFGDANDRWVRTRPLWNQHTYHVTNVLGDGRVPETERANWSTRGLNNYRQNTQGEGVFNAPDLFVAGISADLSACPALVLRAIIANEGNLGVPSGVRIDFYRAEGATRGELLGSSTTGDALLPGGSTEVSFRVDDPGEGTFAFIVVIDGEEEVVECDEDDNEGALGEIDCGLLI